MAGIPLAEATNLVNAWTGKAAYVATVNPLNGRLYSTVGTASTSGTELVNSGGSGYAPQSISGVLGTTTDGKITNATTLTYTNLPAVASPGVQSIEAWDSATTPVRKIFAPLTTAKITALGDSISFAPGALNFSIA